MEKLLSAAMVSILTQPSLVSFSPVDGCSKERAGWTADSEDDEWSRENKIMVDRKKDVNKSKIIDLKISWSMDELGLRNVQCITKKQK